MDNKQERIFPEGFFINIPESEKAKQYIHSKISINCETFYEFMKQHQNEKGYINIDVKYNQSGNGVHGELNTYKKEEKKESEYFGQGLTGPEAIAKMKEQNQSEPIESQEEIQVEDIPF